MVNGLLLLGINEKADSSQGILDKMRIDLRVQGLQFSLTLAPLLLNDALHQRLDLIEHFVEFTGKQADFIRGGDADTLGERRLPDAVDLLGQKVNRGDEMT